MPSIRQDHWTFTHRLNPDGSFSSICPVCFETVGREENELDLQPAEHSHVCNPGSLGKLAYFSGSAQD